IPPAPSRTTTSCGPGAGSGRSSTSKWPAPWMTHAFIAGRYPCYPRHPGQALPLQEQPRMDTDEPTGGNPASDNPAQPPKSSRDICVHRWSSWSLPPLLASWLLNSRYADPMRISIGSDHAGFTLKPKIIELIRQLGHEVQDCGSYDSAPVDFPDVSR